MIELTVFVSEATFKKARGLSRLRNIPADQMDGLLAEMIDKALNQEILDELGVAVPASPQPTVARAQRRPQADQFHDVSGIGEGLGDEDPGETEEERAAATPDPAPRSKRQPEPPPANVGGLTEEALDTDMSVEDPEHEAKVDAPTFADQMSGSAEEAFSTASGYEPPPKVPEAPAPLPRSTVRKRAITGTKGRVTSAAEAHDA